MNTTPRCLQQQVIAYQPQDQHTVHSDRVELAKTVVGGIILVAGGAVLCLAMFL